MEYKKIKLSEITDQKVGDNTTVEFYRLENSGEVRNEPHPAMIVVPGGGYAWCSRREAEPIALRYCSEGFNCFVLSYSVNVTYPLPHFELSILFRYVYEHADELCIDKNNISIVGFSAGGHLCASYGFLYPEFAKQLGCDPNIIRPHTIVLAYPVASTIMETNSDTKKIITGGSEELAKKLSGPENVTSEYPPTYIWTTKVDQCVPMEHSVQMAEALKKHGVAYQFDLFDFGVHGGSLCNRAVYAPDFNFDEVAPNRMWIENSVNFIFKK